MPYWKRYPNGTIEPHDNFVFAVTPNEDRQIAKTTVGNSEVSTVFLCVDHNFTGRGLPILWETMIFGGVNEGLCHRYSSEQEAIHGHNSVVRTLLAENPDIIPLHTVRPGENQESSELDIYRIDLGDEGE